MLIYTIFSYTDWISDMELKFKIGYISIGLIALHLMVHMSIMTAMSIKAQIDACKWKFIMSRYNKQRRILQKKLQKNREKRKARNINLREN